MSKPMNVVLAVSDTLRRDFLSFHGNDWIRTPNLEGLAAESTVFDNFYVGNFPSLEVRMDLITGRHTIAYYDWSPLPPGEVVISEILGEAGYTTMLICDHPALFIDGNNFGRGYAGNVWVRGQSIDRWKTAPKNPPLPCAPDKILRGPEYLKPYLRNVAGRRHEEDYSAARVGIEAGRWLEENLDNQPFFLHLEFFDPHEPFDPPRHYVDSYDPGYAGDDVMMPRYEPWADFMTERELEHTRALYAGEVTMVDTWFGHVLDRLAELGLAENTVVIFLSDHGYYLGEHGWIGKSRFKGDSGHRLPLYEEIVHIPLVVRVPGATPARADPLVQVADIAPTILDLCGVKPAPTHQGQSFRRILEGDMAPLREFALSGTGVHQRGRYRPATITTTEWSLIHTGKLLTTDEPAFSRKVDNVARYEVPPDPVPGPELFHLPTDPGQQINRIESDEGIAQELVDRYVAFLRGLDVSDDALELRKTLKL